MLRALLLASLFLVASGTEEAPRASFHGTLGYQLSKKSWTLTVPVIAQVGDSKVQVSSYDLPLVLPEGTEMSEAEKLIGSTVTATGYLFGEPRQLLAVELARGVSEGKAKPRVERKSDDYLPKEVKEKQPEEKK